MLSLQERDLTESLMKANRTSQHFGLTLTAQEAELILRERKKVLQEQRRVEFGESILPRLIYEFCDSAYIEQENYADTLVCLQELFYRYKNETQDRLSDEELLELMKELFETVCAGDMEYLDMKLAGMAGKIRAAGRQSPGGR